MSKTSKSPRKVLLAAYTAAKDALPEYASKYSPKKFTQHQLFAILVLKIFWNTERKGVRSIFTILSSIEIRASSSADFIFSWLHK